jgi:2-polyprenyl-3-methyl-5-hydroxy-6-metoxy-1,4-benzoquinol methylase
MSSGSDWYRGFFDRRYLQFYPVLLAEPLATEDAAFVARALELPRGARLLDLGCGTGRHSVPLAELGLEVTGLDLSADLLSIARASAEGAGVSVRFVERDMRELDGLGPFDACVSLYTAFGFLGEEGDAAVLRAVAAALRPGGRFLLDLTNFLMTLRRLPHEVWRELEQGVTRERSTYEPETATVVTERTCFGKDGSRLDLPTSHVRAYLPHEVLALLRGAGLELLQTFGALAAVPFVWDRSPNQVYLCRKPGAAAP